VQEFASHISKNRLRFKQFLFIKELWDNNTDFSIKPLSNEQEADRLDIEFDDDEISTYSDEPASTVLADKRTDNAATTDNRSEVSNDLDTNANTSGSSSTTSANIIKMRFVKDAKQPGAKKKTTKKHAKKNLKRQLSSVDLEPAKKKSKLDFETNTYLRGFLNIILLTPTSDLVDMVINQNIIVTEDHVRPIISEYVSNLPLLYDKLKASNVISEYFDPDAQAQLFSLLKSNENLKAIKCNICSLVVNQSLDLKCNKCDCLFHLKCAKKTYKPKKKAWFCENCLD
jgi:hypothetical protein